MTPRAGIGLVVALVLALSTPSPPAVGAAPADAPAYIVTDLGTLGGPSSSATAISSSGLVVGTADRPPPEFPPYRAFLWQEGIGMTDLGELPLCTRVPRPVGVNDSGWVVGVLTCPGAELVCLFRDAEWRTIPPPSAFDRKTYVNGVNNTGQIVATAATRPPSRAALYEDGVWTELGTLPGDTYSSGGAINSSGQVVGASASLSGSRTFVWQRDTGMVDLGLPVDSSRGSAISDNGLVAGWFGNDDGQSRPFVYRDGEMLDLGTLPGDESAYAFGVNSLGQVVGRSGSGSAPGHAFLWQEGIGLLDLNDLIPANSGWELVVANAINDAGQIVGTGRVGGQLHAMLLEPTGMAAAARYRR